mmetsp:Transcript_16106/g.34846  ORF Transcript_16106/g.34846 Transcript_16106/m.34846 type:complete len:104 (+) Transcript_16106:1288-1599(+)
MLVLVDELPDNEPVASSAPAIHELSPSELHVCAYTATGLGQVVMATIAINAWRIVKTHIAREVYGAIRSLVMPNGLCVYIYIVCWNEIDARQCSVLVAGLCSV